MAKATNAQIERDLRISRPAGIAKSTGKRAGTAALRTAGRMLHEYAQTIYALLYIISAVAAGAILFYDLKPNEQLRNALAAALIAYAAINFVVFIHKGVKLQMNESDGKEA